MGEKKFKVGEKVRLNLGDHFPSEGVVVRNNCGSRYPYQIHSQDDGEVDLTLSECVLEKYDS